MSTDTIQYERMEFPNNAKTEHSKHLMEAAS